VRVDNALHLRHFLNHGTAKAADIRLGGNLDQNVGFQMMHPAIQVVAQDINNFSTSRLSMLS
jgi:hypothetical protein